MDLLGRIVFWSISAVGVYLVATRDLEAPSSSRIVLGWGLIILGACCLLTWDYYRYRLRKARREAAAAGAHSEDEVESGG